MVATVFRGANARYSSARARCSVALVAFGQVFVAPWGLGVLWSHRSSLGFACMIEGCQGACMTQPTGG